MTAEYTLEDGVKRTLEMPEDMMHLDKESFLVYFRIKSGTNSIPDLEHFLEYVLGFPEDVVSRISVSEMAAIINESKIMLHGELCAKSFFPRMLLWFGPKDFLANTRFKQFGLMEEALKGFIEAEDRKDQRSQLVRFAAAAYTPLGLPWTDFIGSMNLILLRLCRTRKIILATEAFILLRTWFSEYFPESFDPGGGKKERDFGFQGIQVRIAGEKFGTVKKAGRAMLHDVFTHIEQQIIINNKK